MERHPSTRASCLVQKLLEDSGNQRPMRDLELSLLCESLFSEQQKLKQVLDWAHAFLSGGSEVHSEFCRAESLMLAEKEENSPLYESSCETTYHYARCTEGGNEIFEGRGAAEDTEKVWKLVSDGHLSSCAKSPPDTPFIPLTSTPGTDKVTQQRNVKSMDASDKQTLSQSDKNNIFTASSAPYLKKESNRPNTLRTKAAEESETPGHRVETKKGVVQEKTEDVWMQRGMKKITEEQESSPEFAMSSKKTKEKSEFEMTQEKERKTPSQSHLEIPQTLTVYEQYQCCVDQLHRLRLRQRKQLEPARETQSSEQTTVNPDVQQLLCENERKNPADNHPIGQSDASKYIEKMETLDHVQTKDCDKLRDRGKHKTCLQYDGKKCYKSLKEKTESETSIDYFSRTSVEQLTATLNDDVVVAVERTAAITINPGPCLKTKGKNQGLKHHQSSVRGQRKKAGSRGASLGLYEKSNSYMHLLNKNEILQSRPLSSQVNRNADAHTLADQMKASSDCKATHTTLYDNPTWKSAAVGAWRCEKANCKYRPAGVAVNAHWLSLPDEVWLSVLSLLPLRDLSRVMQVCRRLHTLATDHTLWRDVKVENSTLTEQWFLLMSTRRPRSLSLYSCSGPSLSFRGLGRFFTQCRNSLEEIHITSCTGPGLHGDQMLSLIGQLCDHVTDVDMSWSGTTDAGVKALTDCCSRLRLKSVVLNGCQITDDPMKKLITRHNTSLCRLEMFGCQFLTPSCLQTIYEMCPDLQHLNIGQVPKVNTDCLTAITSYLKRLISLNLSGLLAVSDATVDTLLQNCVELLSLTLSSCPGVTDLTLHSISKYTPSIKSLDVNGCKAVTDTGIQYLALGCRRLQQLDVSSTCTGNRGVSLLANYCNEHLHTVKLSFCHVGTEKILKLCKHCKRLRVLHLYGCARLPTEGEIRRVNAAVQVQPLP